MFSKLSGKYEGWEAYQLHKLELFFIIDKGPPIPTLIFYNLEKISCGPSPTLLRKPTFWGYPTDDPDH